MAIAFVVATASTTNAIGLPASVTAGDIVILFAARSNNTVAPGTPTGATLIQNKAAVSGCAQLSWLVFTAGGTTAISSVNATHLGCSIYRGQTASTAIGGFTATAQDLDSNLVLLPDFVQSVGDGTSMIVGGYFHNRTVSFSAVTGMTERFDVQSLSLAIAMSDGLFANFTVRTAVAAAARHSVTIIAEIKDSAGAAAAAFVGGLAMMGCGRRIRWDIDDLFPPPLIPDPA